MVIKVLAHRSVVTRKFVGSSFAKNHPKTTANEILKKNIRRSGKISQSAVLE